MKRAWKQLAKLPDKIPSKYPTTKKASKGFGSHIRFVLYNNKHCIEADCLFAFPLY